MRLNAPDTQVADMAMKPTIYKLRIALSDLERNYYDTLNLTVAQHPSETPERMLARILAYCINAQPQLSFARGLSSADEPDIWIAATDNKIAVWIEVGEPSVERLKKAARQASRVTVYSFSAKSKVWWAQNQAKFWRMPVSIYRFEWREIQALAALLQRTMDLSMTITADSAYIATGNGECEVTWEPLQIV